MVITKNYIQKLEEYYRFIFSKELKNELICQLGEEPTPFEYSDQDLWEQSRKIVLSYYRER
ncbi:hypothetical protein DesyoDRAFT_1551 [Desulfosporosinus youngiae DSM 17734]|uniref:Uncharacterized protein n=1 Tax=Desulfosporosinus youngiae DSM 17734 TaxID=768710 RepID=H5Y2K0_9FIRM|nr:hypothetical protein DesyoDRAFT_1551 [Desulfosporosinus youngiae DSM 17734]